jgi:hypothetical protein
METLTKEKIRAEETPDEMDEVIENIMSEVARLHISHYGHTKEAYLGSNPEGTHMPLKVVADLIGKTATANDGELFVTPWAYHDRPEPIERDEAGLTHDNEEEFVAPWA